MSGDVWAGRDGRASERASQGGALSDVWAGRNDRASNVLRGEGA